MFKPIAIIGAGMAGVAMVKALRQQDADLPICLITADQGNMYSKPMLSAALSKNKSAADLVMGSVTDLAESLQFDCHTQTEVSQLDTIQQQVLCADTTIDYQACVLATGSKAQPLLIPGAEFALSINDLNQYRQFRQQLTDEKHITIIGGGLVGTEFAQDLISAGCQVTVVHQGGHPVNQLLIPVVGLALQDALAQAGVEWYCLSTVRSLEQRDQQITCQLNSGQSWQTDLVLSAIGIEANVGLAQSANLPIDQAIITDAYCRVEGQQNVYALGDCAQVAGRHLCFVSPIHHCAPAIAQTLAGALTAVDYPVMPITLKTPSCPLVVVPPPVDCIGEWQVETNGGGINAQFLDLSGQLRGFMLTAEQVGLRGQLMGRCRH